jgi:cell division protease FtsH
MTAYHEAGHLMITYLTHPTNDVFKASIIQRGGSLGVVHSIPREELYTSDVNTLKAHIRVSLAGYVAEKLKYGVTSTGVSSDFSKAMAIAHDMVWAYGMGGDGLIGDFNQIPAGGMYRPGQLSEAFKEKLNMATQILLHECVKEVEQVLKAEFHILERFAKELLAREELDYDEIVQIFMEYNKPPKPLPQEVPEIQRHFPPSPPPPPSV